MASTVLDRVTGLRSSAAVKAPCRAYSDTNIALTGLQTIDSVALADGDRVLVGGQTAANDNGIYIVSTGQWQRAPDFSRNNDVFRGTRVWVSDGSVYGRLEFEQRTADIEFDVTSITFLLTFMASDREVLLGARTYYVRTDGSDANDGLTNTAGGAFLTIQKAINAIAALDISIYSVTIQLAAGTYAGNVTVTGPWVGSGTVTLLGNTGNPASVIVNGTISVNSCGRLTISGFETQGSGSTVVAQTAGIVTVGAAMRFGNSSAFMLFATTNGVITFSSGCTIVGSALTFFQTEAAGVIRANGLTFTFSGTLTFTTVAASGRMGTIEAFSSTFTVGSGSVTGQRYNVANNALIFTNGGGASYFPGSIAGATSTGGQYN